MNSYVIHLPESREREVEFIKNNASLRDWEFYEAIRGRDVDRLSILSDGTLHPAASMHPNALGVALTFIEILKKISMMDEPANIIEDDAILGKDFTKNQEELIASIAGKFDIIVWGWNFDVPMYLFPFGRNQKSIRVIADQDDIVELSLDIAKTKIRRVLIPLGAQFGIMCCTVSPAGAKRILKALLPLDTSQYFSPEIKRHVSTQTHDGMLNRIYSKIDSYICFPPLAISLNDKETSTIWNDSSLVPPSNNVELKKISLFVSILKLIEYGPKSIKRVLFPLEECILRFFF